MKYRKFNRKSAFYSHRRRPVGAIKNFWLNVKYWIGLPIKGIKR